MKWKLLAHLSLDLEVLARTTDETGVNHLRWFPWCRAIRVIKVLGFFAGVENESELILARAGIIYMSAKDINTLTICPFHRSELGTGWRRSQNTCRIPDEIASHGKGKCVKGDRGVSRAISKVIFHMCSNYSDIGAF